MTMMIGADKGTHAWHALFIDMFLVAFLNLELMKTH